jgi:hypothetical protein
MRQFGEFDPPRAAAALRGSPREEGTTRRAHRYLRDPGVVTKNVLNREMNADSVTSLRRGV